MNRSIQWPITTWELLPGCRRAKQFTHNWFYNPGLLVRGYFFAAPNLAIDHAVESGTYSAHQTDNA
jgi:hypothetical protein